LRATEEHRNKETSNTEKTTIKDSDTIESTNDMLELPEITSHNSTLQLGTLDFSSDPEIADPPSVHGYINGHPAIILIDSGCASYILSSAFALRTQTQQVLTRPIPVQLAIRNAEDDPRIRLKTANISINIGNFSTRKAFYIAPLSQYDAILGEPFITKNNITFSETHVTIGKNMIPRLDKPSKTCTISTIT